MRIRGCVGLAVLVCGVAAVMLWAPAPVQAQASLAKFERLHLAGEHREAAELAEREMKRVIAAGERGAATWAFNAACAWARAGEAGKAEALIKRCAELGWGGLASLENDEDLVSIRGTRGYAEAVEIVKERAEQRLDRFRAVAQQHEPSMHVSAGARETLAEGGEPPLLLALHHTGGTGAEAVEHWTEAADAAGAILVGPDALRPNGSGFSWVFRDESEWMVLHQIDRAAEEYGIDPENVVLCGFSQGANIAFMMGQKHPDRFVGVVPYCGHYEADVAELPEGLAEGAGPRWRLVIGAMDPWASTYEQAEADFEAAGMDAERTYIDGVGHSIPRNSKGRKQIVDAVLEAFGRSG